MAQELIREEGVRVAREQASASLQGLSQFARRLVQKGAKA
jgi:hypothetical protein